MKKEKQVPRLSWIISPKSSILINKRRDGKIVGSFLAPHNAGIIVRMLNEAYKQGIADEDEATKKRARKIMDYLGI